MAVCDVCKKKQIPPVSIIPFNRYTCVVYIKCRIDRLSSLFLVPLDAEFIKQCLADSVFV
nr:MAG TPA: hypothetical protein [Caudoviricetes sp.]